MWNGYVHAAGVNNNFCWLLMGAVEQFPPCQPLKGALEHWASCRPHEGAL